MNDKKQAVFLALADPTRRSLVETLAENGEKTATELANELPITRQGITKHLKILETADLVTVHQVGRDKRYTLTPTALDEAVSWVTAVQQQWQQRLNALYDYLASEQENET